MVEINDLLLVVALVTQVKAGNAIGTATGFFYLSGDRLFFVTNRHVVLPDPPGAKPDSLSVLLHTDGTDLTKNTAYPISLYAGTTPLYFIHPQYVKTPIDVAVIPLDISLKDRFVFKALSKANLLPEHFVLSPGDDAMVVGFPRGGTCQQD